DKDKLRETLQVSNMRLYCVLDGAAVPDLPKRLYRSRLKNYCLLRGKLTPDVVHMAPYVVYLKPDSDFTSWVLDESFGKNWGIFAHSRSTITEMRRHFRSLINVHDEDGNPLIFRFYDPRVIRRYLPTCNLGEVKVFFGKIESYYVEADNEEKLLRYAIKDNELKVSEIDLESKE
ncbi:MAG: DUF4123 domain-containing protein, partial [Acidobacteriota bacterium]|nr:DUF4123 domain-containing protein [Acidobacteriota bacterium]